MTQDERDDLNALLCRFYYVVASSRKTELREKIIAWVEERIDEARKEGAMQAADAKIGETISPREEWVAYFLDDDGARRYVRSVAHRAGTRSLKHAFKFESERAARDFIESEGDNLSWKVCLAYWRSSRAPATPPAGRIAALEDRVAELERNLKNLKTDLAAAERLVDRAVHQAQNSGDTAVSFATEVGQLRDRVAQLEGWADAEFVMPAEKGFVWP